jgi:hypothetical protein
MVGAFPDIPWRQQERRVLHSPFQPQQILSPNLSQIAIENMLHVKWSTEASIT